MKSAATFLLLFATASAHAAEFVIGTNIHLKARDAKPGPEYASLLAYDLTVAIGSDCDFPGDGRMGCHDIPISFRQLSSITNPDVTANSLVVVSNGQSMGRSVFPGWYSAEEGDLFNSREIGNDRFGRYLLEGTVLEPGDDGEFYLGVSFDRGFLLGPTNGWARMRSTSDGIELLDNAVFYEQVFVGTELGIVIGSSTPVPEPGSLFHLLFGVVLLRLSPRR